MWISKYNTINYTLNKVLIYNFSAFFIILLWMKFVDFLVFDPITKGMIMLWTLIPLSVGTTASSIRVLQLQEEQIKYYKNIGL